ncbi:TlpA family protein disulfide reductase [bacterium]|nr:TlpA family protein disulfide reductase [bacterium]
MTATRILSFIIAAALLLSVSCNKPAGDATDGGTTVSETQQSDQQMADAGNADSGMEQDNPGEGSETDSSASARRLPDFSFRSSEGEVLAVSSFYGKPLVINFWGDWCPPCINELPALNDVYKERKAEFEMLAISVDSTAAEDFWKQNAFEIPMYHSVDAKEKLGLMAFPATFFLNEEGSIVGYVTGEMSREDFETRLKTILRQDG